VLSGGERRRVALCKLLLEAPDLLLLDEPTNHLDAESVLWLEKHLAQYAGRVLAVTHDRYFLDNVAEWILELDRGRAFRTRQLLHLPGEEAGAARVQGKKDAKLSKRLKEELEWVRQNAKGRQTKSKSRLARYEEMAAEAEKNRKLDFEEIQIPAGPRLGSVVIEAKDLKKGFGDRVLIDGLSFTMPRGGIVGIIGPERRRQDHPVQDDRRPGEADDGESGSARRSRSATSTRTAPASTRPRPSGRSSPRAWTTSRSARRRCRAGRTSGPSASRARTSRRRPACCPAVSATG
jgi:ABC-type multidrug transport system fused ATPase/permease subunit